MHLHSVYSLLDGAIRIPDLIQHVKLQGMNSVAITDHGNMFGVIDFYEEAKRQGVKPIIGCEVYVAGGSRFEKRQVNKVADGGNYHLVLLAKNKQGYKNLIKLTSLAYLEGFYRKPRIDYDLLADYSEGLIGLTACLGGEVNRYLLEGEDEKAYQLAGHLSEIFGKQNFYLEIQDHGIPEQFIAAKGAITLHKRLGVPLVLTNDAHFLKSEDQKAQDIMLRIQMGKTLEEEMMFGFNEEFYVKSPEEMKRLFPEFPDAYHNTMLISDMIDLDLNFGDPLLPDFKVPAGMSLYGYLKKMTFKGLSKRFSDKTITDLYTQRLNYELKVIHEMGYEGYFLIVADFVQFAKSKHIPVGPGRGSAAGSLVAFSLEITDVDPLKYNLLFERFLNPSRKEMPDIDIDFCRDRREEVYDYVVEKYGKEHVSQIITFGTLSAKAVLKDVARVLAFPYEDINTLTKSIPDIPNLSLDDALNIDLVRHFFEKGDQEKFLLEVARKLEHNPRNHGKHAAGVVISPEPLINLIPLAYDNKTDSIITQLEKEALEKVGLVKMDFLGLKNLTIIDSCIRTIEKRRGVLIDLINLPLDNKKTYDLLYEGSTKGVFQLENTGITQLLVDTKPTSFEDIVACIALYRPGPLQSGMTEDYVKRKQGKQKIEYPHNDLHDILEETLGTVVYQEQVMLISQIIGGFSMAKADNLRKAMGKKKQGIVDALKQDFLDGAVKNKYEIKWAEKLYNQLSEFASYGFNKSHSVAYGLITYQTAYLKSNYLVEFLKSSMDADIENTDSLIGLIYEAESLGVEILSPDINESNSNFTIIDDNTIRYGLFGIKGLGKVVVDTIQQVREEKGNYRSIPDFISSLPSKYIHKKMLESLIGSGVFDCFEHTRKCLWDNIPEILQYGSKQSSNREIGQNALFGNEEMDQNFILQPVKEWEDLEKAVHERKTLGIFLGLHPLKNYMELLQKTDICMIDKIDDNVSSERKLKLVGVIEKVKNVNARRGTSFWNILISDLTGRHEIRLYSDTYTKYEFILQENTVAIFTCKSLMYRDKDIPVIITTCYGVEPLEKISQHIQRSLHLNIYSEISPSSDILSQKVFALRTLFQKHSGSSPVYLHYFESDKKDLPEVIKIHPKYNVEYSRIFIEELRKLLKESEIAWQEGESLHFLDGRSVQLA